MQHAAHTLADGEGVVPLFHARDFFDATASVRCSTWSSTTSPRRTTNSSRSGSQPEHGRACGAMLQHGRTDVGLTRGSDLFTAVSELL